MPTKSKPTSRRNTELAAAVARTGRPLYQVASDCSIHPRTLGDLLGGRRTVRPEVEERIATTLGVSRDALFG